MAELREGYFSIPPVTRTLVTATAVVTLPCLLALVSPYQVVFYLPAIRQKLQLWRLITPFFYAGSGLSALFNVFFLFSTSRNLEDGLYRGRPADLSWALVCMSGGILALNYPLKSMLFFRSLLLALTHFWGQLSPDQPMSLYGFVTIPSKYLSYALLVMDLVQGGPSAAMEGLTGIISAHVFHYLHDTYPRANPGARRWTETPNWWKALFGLRPAAGSNDGRTRNFGGGVTGMAPARRPATPAPASAPAPASGTGRSTATSYSASGGGGSSSSGGVTWGRGNRLG